MDTYYLVYHNQFLILVKKMQICNCIVFYKKIEDPFYDLNKPNFDIVMSIDSKFESLDIRLMNSILNKMDKN